MMARKPRMLVAVALANKMARTAWAMLMKNENYRNPATPRPDPGRVSNPSECWACEEVGERQGQLIDLIRIRKSREAPRASSSQS